MTSGTDDTFRRALALHQRGQVADARALYGDVLRRESHHFDSLHLLGLTHVQEGRPELGLDFITRAIAVRSDYPEAHYNLGNALLSLGRPADALVHLDAAIRLNGKDPQYHLERGNALQELGQAEEALACFDVAVRLDPGLAEAHNNAGIILKEARRFEEALLCYDRALRLKPDYAEAHTNRGNVLKELGRAAEALACHDQAIGLRPRHAEAHSNRGNALAQLKRFEDALASHDRAIALKPGYAEAHNNRGNVLKELERHDEALASFDRAIALKPTYAEAYTNRGNVLKDMKRHDEALASHDKAISLRPGFAEAHNNRGNLLKDLDRIGEAHDSYAAAARIDPSHVMARYNMALLDLQRHDFRQGFDLYRLRWEADRNDRGPHTTIPAWDGSASDGEVLLWAEQGIGDEVFFASMLSLIDLDRVKIALSADKRLHPIYERSFPGVRLLDRSATRNAIAGDYAAQAPIGNLGHILHVDEMSLARRHDPYLMADAARTASLRQANPLPPGNIICGLSWKSGNRKAGGDRSIALSELRAVLQVPGVTFVNLQYGDVAAEIEGVRQHLDADMRSIEGVDVYNDIDGLLALMHMCDTVISIDNLTAHLAGAIGKPSCVLVPIGGGRHWYWGGESQSLWYPSLELIYQRRIGDWGAPIERAVQRLAGMAGRASAATT